jgi:hypothetical protein
LNFPDIADSGFANGHFGGPLDTGCWILDIKEDLAKVTYPVIPAEAGIQNSFNPAPSGTGFRVALRLPGMTIPS